MTTTRRTFLHTGVAATAVAGAPGLLRAQTGRRAKRPSGP
jgi:hypothetical protein